jgi:hypothetical protein
VKQEKLKRLTYVLMVLTLGLIALGVIFPIGIVSMYIALGIPISGLNVYLIHSALPSHHSDHFKRWSRRIYLFYGALLGLFILITITIALIFSGSFQM